MTMLFLIMPKERFSPIDYFLEELNQLGEVTGIKLTSSAYIRMKKDPYIYQDSNENGELEKWVGEEITIGDKYYPPLSYLLFKQNDVVLVKKIQYGEKVIEFDLGSYNVVIDY